MCEKTSYNSEKPLRILDWGLLEYGKALARQRELVEQRINDSSIDSLVLVEHPPVVTIGRSGGLGDILVPEHELRKRNIGLYHVDRGGMATFHGPGQLVAYPIVKLEEDKDLHHYVRELLWAVSSVLLRYGLNPQFRPEQPGIWVRGAKIASVGIAVKKWVTYHGVALNVNVAPEWFNFIVPCGQANERITSMKDELGRTVNIEEVKREFVNQFCRLFGYAEAGGGAKRPSWLTRPAPDQQAISQMEEKLRAWKLATVCESAHCPNLGECFSRGTATFMILGTRCTRRCRFCAVNKGTPEPVDPQEPKRVAGAVQALGLRYVVITSVTRDDLADGGALQFARTIQCIREEVPDAKIEVLVPDFRGAITALHQICEARPDTFNHNIETVARLYPVVRPRAQYRRSLGVLEYAARNGMRVKSGLMVGLGESESELRETFADLRRAGCESLTIGQYLLPSRDHLPVRKYFSPQDFENLAAMARGMGFRNVVAGPLVRSSYKAEQMFIAREEQRTSERGWYGTSSSMVV